MFRKAKVIIEEALLGDYPNVRVKCAGPMEVGASYKGEPLLVQVFGVFR